MVEFVPQSPSTTPSTTACHRRSRRCSRIGIYNSSEAGRTSDVGVRQRQLDVLPQSIMQVNGESREAEAQFSKQYEGKVADPRLSFTSKYLSVDYDVEGKSALVKGSFELGPGLQLRATRDIKAQQGEVAMVADLAGPAYKIELSSPLQFVGLPKATIKFPLGEISFVHKEEEEEEKQRMLSINGILKGQVLNGVCTVQFRDENLNLRYSYKDEQMAFIPSISLPSNTLSLAFKRRFGPSDKLSYLYNFDSNFWSAVYKHTVRITNLKLVTIQGSDLAGHLSGLEMKLVKQKTAPMKMIVQFMLEVPRDNIRSSNLMLRVKNRWNV